MPVRMNLTSVKIRRQRATSALHDDPAFKAPRTAVQWDAEIVLRCQVEIDSWNSYAATHSGSAERSSGHLTFSKAYLDAKGIVLRVGDRITAVLDKGAAYTTTDFRVVQVRPTGRLPNPTLVIVAFTHDGESKGGP